MATTYWRPAGDGRYPTTLRNRGEPAGFAKVAGPALAAAMRRANRTDPAVLKDRLER
jgi:hypothetical protein